MQDHTWNTDDNYYSDEGEVEGKFNEELVQTSASMDIVPLKRVDEENFSHLSNRECRRNVSTASMDIVPVAVKII